MIEEKKNQIPPISDKKLLKAIEDCDGSSEGTINALKTTLHAIADLRVFMRRIYSKLPKNTDKEILNGKD